MNTQIRDLARLHTEKVDPASLDCEVEHYSIPAWESRTPELVHSCDIESHKILLPRCEHVLVSCLNPSTHKVWRMDRQSSPTVRLGSTEWAVVVPNDSNDIDYLTAVMEHPSFSFQMQNYLTGTTNSHQRVRKPDFMGLSVPDLRMDTRNIISSHYQFCRLKMQALDESSRILREMIRGLHQSFFLDVETTSKDSSARHPLLGVVPHGWEVGSFGDLVSEIESGTRPKGGAEHIEDGVPSIGAESIEGLGIFDHSKVKHVSFDYFSTMRRGIVRPGDVLLYKDGAYTGRVSMFDHGFPFTQCAVNEHVFRIRARPPFSQEFLFASMDNPLFQWHVESRAVKAAQPGLNKTDLCMIPVLLPPTQVVECFTAIVQPMFQSIFAAALERRNLSTLQSQVVRKLID